jgi:hypothetical protein
VNPIGAGGPRGYDADAAHAARHVAATARIVMEIQASGRTIRHQTPSASLH